MNCYPFIEAEKAQRRNVKRACELLKVSRAAYYAARGGQPSARSREDAELTVLITAEHKRSRGCYGAPRIHAELRGQGRQAFPQADRPADAPGRDRRAGSQTLEEDHDPRPGRCGPGRCDPPGLHRRRGQDQHEDVLAGQQRSARGQLRQDLPVDLLQLQDVPPGERPQERSRRGRRADTAEQCWHRTVAQQVHVIDAVRPGGHPGNQASAIFSGAFTPHGRAIRTCSAARHPGRPAPPGPSPGPGPPATRDSGHQTSRGSSRAHATIALARCPLQLDDGSFSNSHRPSSEGTFRVNAPEWAPIYTVD